MLAAAAARSSGRGLLWRFEDLDIVACRTELYESQYDDVSALGIVFDGDPLRQSTRRDRHNEVVADLRGRGLLYPCFCSRREVLEAAQAPHGDEVDGAYPGTCRELSEAQRSTREREGRRPAWRVRAEARRVAVLDERAGRVERLVDDFVVCRADGVPAYNLASVVDDADTAVTQVVRGHDLLGATPRHAFLQALLGFATPQYVHVPLVVGADGERLAKRHGAVTRAQLRAMGWSDERLWAWLAESCGFPGVANFGELAAAFDWALVPDAPAVWP